ncbi:MAG: hypothetical protein FD174_195 [Geobacteraceae bacterium]|nr:MAG: hypothetical protein FD174_195 [Geobacteraceae bacterium]
MLSVSNTMISKSIENNVKLIDAYNYWFDVVPVDTIKLLEEAYRLRYQVYCKENNFETPDAFPDDCETDEFDTRSVHSLLFDRLSRSFVGTVRIILPQRYTPGRSFPIQNICSHPLLADRKLGCTQAAAEISRFAISKEYRRKAEDYRITGASSSYLHERLPVSKELIMPCITLGLIKAIMQMSVEHGITELFAVMEPALLRLLSRFSIYFRPIGPLVDYHGMRQPCYSNIETLMDRVRKERIDVWEVITDEGRLLKRQERAVHFCT